jgi:lysophospholipase L1-like esterase
MDVVALGLAKAAAKVDSRRAFRRTRALAASEPTTVATPPTITTAAGVAQTTSGTTGSTLTSPINYPYNTTTKWRFVGGTPFTSGAAYYGNGLLGAAASASFSPAFFIDFYFEGQSFEFAYRATNVSPAGWRLMVDGQWAGPAQFAATSDALRYLVKVDFGSRAVRRIRLQFSKLPFGGINIAGTDAIWPGPAPALHGLVLGDSYVEGIGASYLGSGLASQIADRLGWDDPDINGEGGTGYVNYGTSAGFAARLTYADRLDATVLAYNPEAVIVFGSVNDDATANAAFTPAAAQAAATALYDRIAAGLPKADLFVVGVPPRNSVSAHAANIKAAAQAHPFVKLFVDPNTGTDGQWITGSGIATSPSGTGIADFALATDRTHPTQEGHDMFARRIAAAIKSYYAGLII